MRLDRLRLSDFRETWIPSIEFEAGYHGYHRPERFGQVDDARGESRRRCMACRRHAERASRFARTRAAPREQVNVELDFDLAGHATSYRAGSTAPSCSSMASRSPIAASISAVSDLLRRRLGMSHDEFFPTYFTGQKELGVMAPWVPSERAQFLARVLGYERLKTAQEIIRERRSGIDAEIKGLRAGMPDPEVVHRGSRGQRPRGPRRSEIASALEERDRAPTRARRGHAALGATPTRARRDAGAGRPSFASSRASAKRGGRDMERVQVRAVRDYGGAAGARRAHARIGRARGPRGRASANWSAASNEQARHKTLSDGLRLITDEVTALAERRARRSRPRRRSNAEAAEELARMRAEFEQVQAQFETGRTEWVRDKQEAETKREALLAQLKDVQQQRDQIVDLGEGGICPICARPLGTHFRSVLEVLDTQIETITVRREVLPGAHGAAGRHAAGGRRAGRTPASAARAAREARAPVGEGAGGRAGDDGARPRSRSRRRSVATRWRSSCRRSPCATTRRATPRSRRRLRDSHRSPRAPRA